MKTNHGEHRAHRGNSLFKNIFSVISVGSVVKIDFYEFIKIDDLVKSHIEAARWLSKKFDIQGVVFFDRGSTIHVVCRAPVKNLQRSRSDFLRRHQDYGVGEKRNNRGGPPGTCPFLQTRLDCLR